MKGRSEEMLSRERCEMERVCVKVSGRACVLRLFQNLLPYKGLVHAPTS